MIRYALQCEHDHEFEGWFGVSSDYDDQHARGLLECPTCASKMVRKAVMAPAVAGTKAQVGANAAPPQMREMMMEHAQAVRAHVEENFDYVGDSFAKEARDIHEGKSEERGIYGEASGQEVKKLVEDGVPVAAMPPKPHAKTDLN